MGEVERPRFPSAPGQRARQIFEEAAHIPTLCCWTGKKTKEEMQTLEESLGRIGYQAVPGTEILKKFVLATWADGIMEEEKEGLKTAPKKVRKTIQKQGYVCGLKDIQTKVKKMYGLRSKRNQEGEKENGARRRGKGKNAEEGGICEENWEEPEDEEGKIGNPMKQKEEPYSTCMTT